MNQVFLFFILFSVHIDFTRSYGAINFKTHPTNSIDKSLATKALQLKNETKVVSALSVKLSLCKLATVAEEEAQKELLSALGFTSESQLEMCYLPIKEIMQGATEASLIYLNKLYFNFTMDLDPLFIANASELHGVQVDKVGFESPRAARSFINNWIDQASYSRVQDLLDVADVTKGTSVLIVNAIHFKVSWQEQFSAKYTKTENFRTIKGNIVKVQMMHRDGQYFYYESKEDNFKLLTTYLVDLGTSFTIVVPSRPDGLSTFLAKMVREPGFYSKIRNLARNTMVSLKIPRFKIKTTVDWRYLLEQVGVKQVFNSTTSGLDAILRTKKNNEAIYLSKIKQKIFFELDEYGIYRGAGNDQFAPDPGYGDIIPGFTKVDLTADRPFFFSVNLHGVKLTNPNSKKGPERPSWKITDELLTGVYYGPEE